MRQCGFKSFVYLLSWNSSTWRRLFEIRDNRQNSLKAKGNQSSKSNSLKCDWEYSYYNDFIEIKHLNKVHINYVHIKGIWSIIVR